MRSDEARVNALVEARARSTLYNLCAELLLPPTEELATRLASGDLVADAERACADLPRGATRLRKAVRALVEALRTWSESMDRVRLDVAYLRIFGPSVGQLHPPYSTEYERDGGFRKEQEIADIAGFYRAWGVQMADDLHERCDHVGVEADFLAFMALKEAYALAESGEAEVEMVRSAAQRFAGDYVAPVARTLADRLTAAHAEAPFGRAAELLATLVEAAAPETPRRRIVALPVVPESVNQFLPSPGSRASPSASSPLLKIPPVFLRRRSSHPGPPCVAWLGPELIHKLSAVALAFVIVAAPRATAAAATNNTAPADGKALYSHWCAPCHGTAGNGKGELAYLLFPRPRDFTKGIYKFRSAPSPSVPTDEDLLRTIDNGIPGTAMPSWSFLPEGERREIVQVVKSFSPEFSKPAAPPIVIGAAPASSQEILVKGKELYTGLGCPACHGESGRGDGASATTLKDDLGDPIYPYDFTQASGFRSGNQPQDLYRAIMTGLTGTPMPSFAAALPNEQDRWALVHYLRSLADAGGASPPTAEKLVAARVDKVPTSPTDAKWASIAEASVRVRPLWWRRVSADRVSVRVAQDGKQIAFLLEWDDTGADQKALASQQFRDAAAIQFATGVTDPAKAPFLGMGSHEKPIEIWHWKADWQLDLAKRADVGDQYPNMFVSEYPLEDKERAQYRSGEAAGNLISANAHASSVEDLHSTGPGTLTAEPADHQRVVGDGIWKDGKWRVVVSRDLACPCEIETRLDVDTAVVAFALWDGSAGDRNGQKSVSGWIPLEIGAGTAGGAGGCAFGFSAGNVTAMTAGVVLLFLAAALTLSRRRVWRIIFRAPFEQTFVRKTIERALGEGQ